MEAKQLIQTLFLVTKYEIFGGLWHALFNKTLSLNPKIYHAIYYKLFDIMDING
jgi:hypothetical protein